MRTRGRKAPSRSLVFSDVLNLWILRPLSSLLVFLRPASVLLYKVRCAASQVHVLTSDQRKRTNLIERKLA